MVSLRKKFGVYFFISALVLVCLLMPAELKASQQCCRNGKLTTCPNLPNGQQYDLSGCQLGLGPVVDPDRPVIIDPDKPIIIGPIEAGCTSGQTQYQPKGDCGTSSRSCCSDGTWSDWDGECSTSSSCGLNECWNGSACVSKPTSTACTCNNGTCSLVYTCVSGSGWKSTRNCTCDSGYQKNSSGECVHSSCTQSCSSGKYRVEISSGLRAGECDCCSPRGVQKKADGTCGAIGTYIDCRSADYNIAVGYQTCCRKIGEIGITTVYSLPSTYSSCSNWGSDMGWSMESTECCIDRSFL